MCFHKILANVKQDNHFVEINTPNTQVIYVAKKQSFHMLNMKVLPSFAVSCIFYTTDTIFNGDQHL